MFRRLYFALLLAAAPEAPAAASPSDAFEVRADHAACLIANRAGYQRLKDDILFIYAALCPKLSPTRQQRDSFARNAGPDENPESRILVIERRHLRCFFDRLAASRRLVQGASDIVRVSIADCR